MYLGAGASLNHKSGSDDLQGKYGEKQTKDETPRKKKKKTWDASLRESTEGKWLRRNNQKREF